MIGKEDPLALVERLCRFANKLGVGRDDQMDLAMNAYASASEAARAYDEASVALRGEAGRVNFGAPLTRGASYPKIHHNR